MSGFKMQRNVYWAMSLVIAILFWIVILTGSLATVSSQSSFTIERNTDRPGQDYRDFDLPRADVELCRTACAAEANCRAFTYVNPGVQGTSARCWLKTGAPTAYQSSCCISGVKGASGVKGGGEDLSGNWYTAVSDNTGKWEYTMALTRESAGKWTGTLYITLNGESPSTTEVAIESLGGGKILYVWRPGKGNAQQFEGTHSKDKISVSGFGGQLLFVRR